MSLRRIFNEINNAILDLQAADYDTYARPLRKLALVLRSDELAPISARLTEGVDLDAFIGTAKSRGMGSDDLVWPSEREEEFGLAIALIERGADDLHWLINFCHRFYHSSSNKHIAVLRKLTSAVIIPFGRDFKAYVEAQMPSQPPRDKPRDSHRVFIVHGHEEAPREMVARFLAEIGLEPVILHEQVNRGMTVVEKLHANSDVGFAVVLLTPDDVGRANDATDLKPRARQNVLLELGYFVGSLGRDRVCALLKGDLEIPSDITGVVYTPFDAARAWRISLARELDAAGYEVDFNKVMRGRA